LNSDNNGHQKTKRTKKPKKTFENNKKLRAKNMFFTSLLSSRLDLGAGAKANQQPAANPQVT